MTGYEFNQEQNKVIKAVAIRCITESILMTLIGLTFIIGVGIKAGTLYAEVITAIQGCVLMGMGISFILPARNLWKVATTEGNDIKEMMSSLKKLNLGFLILFFLVIGSIICDVLLLF